MRETSPAVFDGWLRWIVDVNPGPCRYDHDDCCQAHYLDERPCPMEAIDAYVEQLGEAS